MYYIPIIIHILFVYFGVADCDNETNEWSIDLKVKTLCNSGAARHMCGKKGATVYNRPVKRSFSSKNYGISGSSIYHYRHTTPLPQYDTNSEQFSHGTLHITEPLHPVPPPFDASYRVIGGVRVPGIGADTDVYGSRTMGERHDDGTELWKSYDRYGEHLDHGYENTFKHSDMRDTEDDLMHMSHDDEVNDEEQPCTLVCLPNEYLCAESCVCISKFTRCDGVINCEEGEDEKDCTLTNEQIVNEMKAECEATEKHIMCPRTFACISTSFLCDGDDDCGDFSDETRCGVRVNCSEDQFECANGLCVPKQWACDGDNDCKDFSDEVNCTKLFCDTDEFQCSDGSCVSASFHCDGEFDCFDHSDEISCQTPIPDCPEGEFKCKGSVSGSGSSPGNRCILMRFRCDGDNDCGDWSDELECENTKLTSCTSSEFKCDDGSCIPSKWRCDFEQDCDGGEDEKSCTDIENKSGKRTCADDEYKCKDGRCILKTWLCDGFPDCSKHFDDEINCTAHCEVGQFSCPIYKNMTSARICVEQKHICDGHPDCLYGEDEKNCPKIRECSPNSKCQQLCVASRDGRDECACNNGYVLHENRHNCSDIDECQFKFNTVCSQICINTPGSFRCNCTSGYILRPDLRTCKAMGGAIKLIMANRADIRQVSLSNNKYTSIIKGLHNAISVDFHYNYGLIFWSDISTDQIKMAYMNATGVKSVVKWGLESPGGIAVDWIHDLLFYTDSGTKRIEVTTFDGSLRAVVIANSLDKPRAIVAHPGDALIFWSDWGNGISTSTGPNPKIERSYMDGSERRTIITEGVFWPNGLTIDYSSKRIYWADAKHHVIESSNFDGNDRKKILSMHLPHPFALTLFEDQMFWTDWNTKSISTANKITGSGFRHVHVDLHFPMDIHSYHPSRQPAYPNRCLVDKRGFKGGCSHLCLPNKDNRKCGCPIGLTLKEDQKTCTDIPDKLLLISRKKDIRLRPIQSKNPSAEIDMVVPLDGIKSSIAIEWCSQTNSIFWTDIGRGVVSRAYLNGSEQEEIIQANLISPAGLALDWVTNKIYWTDMGTNRIEVATTNGKQRALLIWQGLNKPRDIVVNPIDGYMFWSGCGDIPMIEIADMDGGNRRSIVSKNLKYPNGLSIDHVNNRLYFVDSGTKTLEYVNFDGSGRKVVVNDGLEHPFGIDVYDRRVYWTDWKTNSVESSDKITGRNRKTIIANMTDLMDLRVFHRDRRSITNVCPSNGGCSHMCLLNHQGHKCACPIGVKLSKDGRTCNDGPTDYIIFAHRIDIRQISLDVDYLIDVVLPLPPMSNTMAVDVDILTGDIFWSETLEDMIMKSTSDGTFVQPVISESIDSVDGLVVDSIGRKLYFTDGGRHTVEVCDLNGSNREVLVWQDLETPRGICIDYAFGYLFWTDWGLHPKIERASMDGEYRHKIVFENLGWPNGLTTDKYEKRIYWTDAQLKHIESSDYNGNHRKILTGGLPHPYGIAVSNLFVYYTDWKTKALHVLDKQNSSQRIIRDNLEGLMEVKVIEKEEKVMENVCGRNNGNCSHLCLRNPKGYSCKCPTGTKLKVDSKTECENLPESYLLIALRSGIGRISLDTPDMFDVVLPINGVYGAVVLDYHYNQSKIFFADVNIDVIKSVDMTNTSKSRNIITSGLLTPNGLAVDWVANNLYWSDTGAKVIEVARLDGSCRKVLIKDGLTDPRSMILYPKRGLLFWSDWGQPARIERSYMDGSDRKAIVDNNLGFPTGLSIDFETRKIYWTDALEDRIEASDLDGRRRTTIVAHASHPFGVTVFENRIFWSDWYNKSVYQAEKIGNHKSEEVRHGLSGALDIRSVSKYRQPNDWTPCAQNNGGCTHLCLFKFHSYKCECPDRPDTRICKSEPDVYVPIRPDPQDEFENNVDDHGDDTDDENDKSSKAKIVIIATAILGTLLILVVAAILVLVLNSKKKKVNRTPSGSTRSVLTFSNPNYNGADGSAPSEPKNTIWKRLKYDKAQDRVYEEKCLGPGPSSSININVRAITHQTPSTSSISPLSTIG